MKKVFIRGEKLLFPLSLFSLFIAISAGNHLKPEPLGGKLPNSHLARSLEFSPDGKRLAVLYSDAQTPRLLKGQIVDVKSGVKLRELQMPKLSPKSDNVGSLSWSPDGKQLIAPTFIYVAKGSLQSITSWDTASGKLRTPPYPDMGVTSTDRLRFSPDSKRIIGEGVPRAVFDVATGQRLNQPDKVAARYGYSVLSDNGQWLVSAHHQDGILRVRDAKTKRVLWQPMLGYLTDFRWSGDVLCVLHEAFTADGDSQSRLLLWNAKTRKQLPSPLVRAHEQIFNFALRPDGHTLVYFKARVDSSNTASPAEDINTEVRVWNYIANRVLHVSLVKGDIMSPHWSPDGEWLLWLSRTNREDVYRLTVWDKYRNPRFERDSVGRITSWSRDGKQLAFNVLETGKSSGKILSSRLEIQRFKD